LTGALPPACPAGDSTHRPSFEPSDETGIAERSASQRKGRLPLISALHDGVRHAANNHPRQPCHLPTQQIRHRHVKPNQPYRPQIPPIRHGRAVR